MRLLILKRSLFVYDDYRFDYYFVSMNKTNNWVFFLLLKYFASSLPAGPGMNISKILLSIFDIDNYSQKKIRFNICA